MSKNLTVSPDLALPSEAVTQTFAIFGKRGSGKSNTAVVIAEELYAIGAPFVVLDPISAWWGLKASFDGKGSGLPVYVFGGPHGDLPLQPTAGELMAQVFIAHRVPMVLDMKGWTGADRARFVTDFALYLLAHNDRTPCHVFMEEADAFVPQRPYKGEERMLGAMDRLVRWGRQEGIGATLITQRSAKVNKDVTTQAETLIAHRTTGPQDRDAIRAWITYHAGEREHEVLSTLPTLPDGVAWVWSPEWLEILKQVRFRRRGTYDSAATPKLGEKAVEPKQLAQVDLDELRDQLAATIEEVAANDPRTLRKRIAELEAMLKERPTAQPERIVERVEVPILDDEDRDLLVRTAEGARAAAEALAAAAESLTPKLAAPRPAPVIPAPERSLAATRQPRLLGLGEPDLARTEAPRRTPESGASSPASLGKAEKAILAALASYPTPLTREQLAFLAGYHPRTPGFVNAVGKLRTAGYVTPEYPAALIRDAVAGLHIERLPGQTIDLWLSRFGKAERLILEHLFRAYPEPMERQALADAAGYHPRTPGFVNALGRLRSLGLVDGFAIDAGFARLVGA